MKIAKSDSLLWAAKTVRILGVQSCWLKRVRPVHRLLASVPGIGFIGASTLIPEIGSIHDFENSDKLTKWAGLTLSIYPSDNVTHTVSITKQGSRHLR